MGLCVRRLGLPRRPVLSLALARSLAGQGSGSEASERPVAPLSSMQGVRQMSRERRSESSAQAMSFSGPGPPISGGPLSSSSISRCKKGQLRLQDAVIGCNVFMAMVSMVAWSALPISHCHADADDEEEPLPGSAASTRASERQRHHSPPRREELARTHESSPCSSRCCTTTLRSEHVVSGVAPSLSSTSSLLARRTLWLSLILISR